LQLNKDRNFAHLTERILNPSITEYKVPDGIQAQLRPYQVTGYKWLKTLAEHELGGILADDMGLGKTLQSIVFIASVISENKNSDLKPHCLIVCPTSLTYNWLDELENFAPFIKAVVVNGNPQERKEIIENYKNYDVLITSYPLIRRDIALYENIDFNTIFIDEAQFIKNDASLNAKSVKRLKARHRFALTGTPIENSLSELWSIFDFIMPGYLHSHAKFVETYEKPILRDDKEALEDLHQLIAPFILRRMKKDVLTELPDKYESKVLTELSEEQKKIYVSYLENIRSEIRNELNEGGLEKSRMKILAALTRLRQICCHPATFLENYQGGSGKLDLLMELITEAIANDHRILVFSQFTSMLR
ncbi:MAG TPA: SNF2-related protein, partial [Mobilitalea sp.]|nr:SNF2-related protein [Mobilitalea sp.]